MMFFKAFLGAAVSLLLAVPAAAQPRAGGSATLVIHVQKVSPKGGTLRLGLYTEASYPDDDSTPVASAEMPAKGGEMVLTLTNVPPGTYAIQTYQDINSNDKMDQSWVGLPLEPFGFSRDARPRFNKPAFDRVKFEVTPGMNVQTIHLQYSIL